MGVRAGGAHFEIRRGPKTLWALPPLLDAILDFANFCIGNGVTTGGGHMPPPHMKFVEAPKNKLAFLGSPPRKPCAPPSLETP